MEPIGKILDKFQRPEITKPPNSTPSENCRANEPGGGSDYLEWTDREGTKLGYGVNPNCPKCRGIGWVTVKGEFEAETKHSKTYVCDGPGCAGETYRAWKNSTYGLAANGVYRPEQTFETLLPRKGVRPMIDAMRAMSVDKPPGPLLLVYGLSGNGKTHACNALAMRLAQRGVKVKFWTVADLFAMLRESIGENNLEFEIRCLKQFEALILDDWATEYATGWEIGKMEQIIDYRYRQRLMTVLTTNRPLDELPDRLVYRFAEHPIGRLVQNIGSNYRLEKNSGRN